MEGTAVRERVLAKKEKRRRGEREEDKKKKEGRKRKETGEVRVMSDSIPSPNEESDRTNRSLIFRIEDQID